MVGECLGGDESPSGMRRDLCKGDSSCDSGELVTQKGIDPIVNMLWISGATFLTI